MVQGTTRGDPQAVQPQDGSRTPSRTTTDIHWVPAAERWREGGVLAEARAELCRQSASRDGEDRRPRSEIQPQAPSGGSTGEQARTSNLDIPDAQGRGLWVRQFLLR